MKSFNIKSPIEDKMQMQYSIIVYFFLTKPLKGSQWLFPEFPVF